jgi:hypothetical protein
LGYLEEIAANFWLYRADFGRRSSEVGNIVATEGELLLDPKLQIGAGDSRDPEGGESP